MLPVDHLSLLQQLLYKQCVLDSMDQLRLNQEIETKQSVTGFVKAVQY